MVVVHVDPRAILSLQRCWVWADFPREVLLSLFERPVARNDNPPVEEAVRQAHGTIALTYWYASVHLVIEAWQQLALRDEKIDTLIAYPHTELLKHVREGVFQYQPDYDDDQFLRLLGPMEDVLPWLSELNDAFKRWFTTQAATTATDHAHPHRL